MTKILLNDRDVLTAIPAQDRTIKNLDLDKLPIERALGQQWNIDTNTFSVKHCHHLFDSGMTHGEPVCLYNI